MRRPSGILLAGGASRRFGRPKILEPVDGAPLFHKPLRALLDSCDDVVIVVAPRAEDLPLPDGADRVSFVHDDVAYEGPLSGAHVGLDHARGEYAALVAADMPGITSQLLSLMAERAFASQERAIVLADADGPRPLPAVLRVTSARALARTLLGGGERRLRALVQGLEAQELPESIWAPADATGAWRHDIDLPGDMTGMPR